MRSDPPAWQLVRDLYVGFWIVDEHGEAVLWAGHDEATANDVLDETVITALRERGEAGFAETS